MIQVFHIPGRKKQRKGAGLIKDKLFEMGKA